MPSTEATGLTRTKNNMAAQQLPPLRGRHGPISDPQFVSSHQRQAMPAFQQPAAAQPAPDALPAEESEEPTIESGFQHHEVEEECHVFADGERPVNEGAEDPDLLEGHEAVNDYDEEDAQSVYMLNGEVMRLI